jgi:hypothetical protein
MTPTFDSHAFDRATDPVLRILDVELARELAEYRPESTIQDRVAELAARCNEGELTEAERAEYLGYVQANKFVAVLQAQARRRAMDAR